MRVGILEKDTQSLVLYSNEYYVDVQTATSYLITEVDKLCNKINITKKSLIEYLSMKRPLANGMELYKLTNDDELIKLL